jgi:S-DNA-T family DNA segregation ATPase FtsK/SpoIIIE
LKLILVDPKRVEMAPYADIPHLHTPIITDPEKTVSALKWAIGEMERRYSLLEQHKKKDIKSYNEWMKQQLQDGEVAQLEEAMVEGDELVEREGVMPYIVIVVDEMSDLMMAASRDVEALIVRIAQKARAVGIHLVLATQRPSVNVVTGLIKANIPARFAFTTTSQVDSKTILDRAGAEKLLEKGDMLMLTARMSKPKRVQGAWVSDEEVLKVTEYLRSQMGPQYDDAVVAQEVQLNGRGGIVSDFGGADDEIVRRAMEVIMTDRKASTSHLQRRLGIGYNRAARVMDELEDRGVVGPQSGSRPREILVGDVDDTI